MRKERKPHRTQLDLFQVPVVTPPWQILPQEVQLKVWSLLVQMFREARCGRRTAQAKEGCDE